MKSLCFSVCFLLGIFSYHVAALDPANITVVFDSDGSPSFKINHSGDDQWLRSGPVKIRAAGQWWSTSNKDKYLLKLTSHDSVTGRNIIGKFTDYKFSWEAYSDISTSAGVKVETAVTAYTNEPIVVFTITYLSGLANASIPNEGGQTLSTFPSFAIEESSQNKRGYATWVGGQVGNFMIDQWAPGKVFGGQADGGYPIVLFDSVMTKTSVLSPLDTFMSANQYSFKDDQSGDTFITFGPMSSIDTIPAGYKYSTILVGGNNVTGTMRKFGEILRRVYGKSDDLRKADFTNNYLGFWTDNGGCYHYYNGTTYSNYEEILVSAKEDADKKGIPFRYVQLDSWWYFKGDGDGVKNWTARPDIFPNGIDSMVKKTGWRPHAHNRYWSVNTDYAKKYKFIVEEKAALPVDPSFWDYLMSSSQTEWGLLVYEQDWLSTEYKKVNALQTTLNLGELWLKQMGDAAQRYGITIQYCMSYPRHLMQSVAIPAVTQIRVSGDYQPSNSQWDIGDSTILAHAVGLAAFKDNFRTSSVDQPDCQKRPSMQEKYPKLEAYVAALSGGPIGPSDQIGTANATLIMTTCMADGRLLQPTHPAMSLDSTVLYRAFGTGGPDGKMTVAYTEIDDMYTWYYLLAAELEKDYELSLTELFPSHSTFPMTSIPALVAFQYTLDGKLMQAVDVGSDNKITVPKCEKSDFQAWTLAPYFDNGWALLGELNKIVSVSEARFSQIMSENGTYTFVLRGVPEEKVTVTFYEKSSKKIMPVDCTIAETGFSVLSIPSESCT